MMIATSQTFAVPEVSFAVVIKANHDVDFTSMRRLWQPTRPYRIIYSLYMEFEPLPTEPPEKTTALFVNLDRNGMGTGQAKATEDASHRPATRRSDPQW